MGGGVGKARIEDDQLCAVGFAIDDALRVRIKVVPRLEVCTDEQYDFRIGMIRAGAIESHP